MKIRFATTTLDHLKIRLSQLLPTVGSSHRVESLARGLGFNTYAGLRTAMRDGDTECELDPRSFVANVSAKDPGLAEAALLAVWQEVVKVLLAPEGIPARHPSRRRALMTPFEIAFGQARLILLTGLWMTGEPPLAAMRGNHRDLQIFGGPGGALRQAADLAPLLAQLEGGRVIGALDAPFVKDARGRLQALFGEGLDRLRDVAVLVIAQRRIPPLQEDGCGALFSVVQEAGWLGWSDDAPADMVSPPMATDALRKVVTGEISLAAATRHVGAGLSVPDRLDQFFQSDQHNAEFVESRLALAGLDRQMTPLSPAQIRLLAMLMYLTRSGPHTGVDLHELAAPGMGITTVFGLYRRWASATKVEQAVQLQVIARINRGTLLFPVGLVEMRWPAVTGPMVVVRQIRAEAEDSLRPFGITLPPSLFDIEISWDSEGAAHISSFYQETSGRRSPVPGAAGHHLADAPAAPPEESRADRLLSLPAKKEAWKKMVAAYGQVEALQGVPVPLIWGSPGQGKALVREQLRRLHLSETAFDGLSRAEAEESAVDAVPMPSEGE